MTVRETHLWLSLSLFGKQTFGSLSYSLWETSSETERVRGKHTFGSLSYSLSIFALSPRGLYIFPEQSLHFYHELFLSHTNSLSLVLSLPLILFPSRELTLTPELSFFLARVPTFARSLSPIFSFSRLMGWLRLVGSLKL